jgi:predicted esterase
MPPSSPTALIVPAVKKHTATVIMAHGLGDSGAGWVSLAENWRRRQKFDEVKFIFPNAPTIPITVVRLPLLPPHSQMLIGTQNMNMRMPGWYDIVRPRDTVRLLAYSLKNQAFISIGSGMNAKTTQ